MSRYPGISLLISTYPYIFKQNGLPRAQKARKIDLGWCIKDSFPSAAADAAAGPSLLRPLQHPRPTLLLLLAAGSAPLQHLAVPMPAQDRHRCSAVDLHHCMLSPCMPGLPCVSHFSCTCASALSECRNPIPDPPTQESC